MAYAPLDVAALAFARMQVPAPVTYADNTPGMNAFRAVWQNGILIPVLREYGWNCAKKRTALTSPSLAITAGSFDGISALTFTIGAHTLQIGQQFYVKGVLPADWNGNFVISAVTGTTVTVQQVVSDAYVSGGTATWSPLMDWSYIYTLPTDWVRIMRMQMVGRTDWYNYSSAAFRIGEVTPDFAVESGFLLTNYQVAQVLYVAKDLTVPPNPPNYDYMIDVLAARTGFELAASLTGANDKALDRFEKRYKLTLEGAKTRDAQEGTPQQYQEDPWITTRMGR